MRVTLGGAEVDLLHRDEVQAEVLHHLQGDHGRLAIAFADLEHVHTFGVDSGLAGAFDPPEGNGAGAIDWRLLPASRLMVRTARRLTGVWWERHDRAELLPEVLRTAGRARARVGVLGGTPAQLAAIETVLRDHVGGIEVAGTWAPPRDVVDHPVHAATVANEVAAADVDLLLVAMGRPRTELFLRTHLAATGARVAVAVGTPSQLLDALGAAPPPTQVTVEGLTELRYEPAGPLTRAVRAPVSALRLLSQSPTEQLEQARHAARPAPLLASPARWRARLIRWLATIDGAGILLSALAAWQIRRELGGLAGLDESILALPVVLAVLPIWLVMLNALGAYRAHAVRSTPSSIGRYVSGAFGGVIAIGFLSYAFFLEVSRIFVGLLFVLTVLWGLLTRTVAARLIRRRHTEGRYVQNVLVVGSDEESLEVARAMERDATLGYRVVGFLDPDAPMGRPATDDEALAHLTVVGRPDDVLDVAYDHRAGLVVVSPSGLPPGLLRELTLALEGSSVDLAVAPSLFQTVTSRVTVEPVGDVPLLHVDQIRLTGLRAFVKRSLDLVGSALLLLLFAPVLLPAMVAVRLDSPGPALFRQVRVGRDGNTFTVLKLRTMVVDAEERLAELADRNEVDPGFFKIKDDPRVTRTGRFLRRWSLDEVPQFWNVLRGDMSLVGPRPPLPVEVADYEPWHLRRLRVRPGVTGVWQTSGRSEVPFDEAVRMDIFYIENWSVGYDLRLLLRTVKAVLRREGAY